jgi:hypothetical protein
MRNLTAKQVEILTLVIKMNPDGSFLDIDQLAEGLGATATYGGKAPTRHALKFSIRYLVGHGLIEKKDTALRRGAQRRILAPTMQGLAEYKALRAP